MTRHDVHPARPRRAHLPALVLAAAAVTIVPPRDAGAGVNLGRLEFTQQSVKLSQQSFVTGMGLRAHLSGGDLNDGLVVVPALEYWRDTDKLPELGVYELMQRDWRIGGDVRYRLGHGDGWRPYGGVGLGLHLTKSRSTVQTQSSAAETRSHSSNKLGPNFLVGVDLPKAGPIRNAIELNWHMVPDLRQFKVNFGLGWEFGGGEGADEDVVY
jgi:hypothetical protein